MKYILNNHTYEGLAGETTDYMRIYDDYKTALEHYFCQKDKCSYLDSFVQLVELKDGETNATILRSYFNEPYGEDNCYTTDNYESGEYVSHVLAKDDNDITGD